MILSLPSITKSEMSLVVHEAEADNVRRNPAIKIAGTNLPASCWAILHIVY